MLIVETLEHGEGASDAKMVTSVGVATTPTATSITAGRKHAWTRFSEERDCTGTRSPGARRQEQEQVVAPTRRCHRRQYRRDPYLAFGVLSDSDNKTEVARA